MTHDKKRTVFARFLHGNRQFLKKNKKYFKKHLIFYFGYGMIHSTVNANVKR